MNIDHVACNNPCVWFHQIFRVVMSTYATSSLVSCSSIRPCLCVSVLLGCTLDILKMFAVAAPLIFRSEERRVGEECRVLWLSLGFYIFVLFLVWGFSHLCLFQWLP